MPFTAGDNEVGYDHVGEWDRDITAELRIPEGIGGETSQPGVGLPGCMVPGDDVVLDVTAVMSGSEEEEL